MDSGNDDRERDKKVAKNSFNMVASDKTAGVLIAAIIIFVIFSQLKVPVDAVQVIFANNHIQDGRITATNVSVLDRYFYAYQSGTYSIEINTSNQTQRIEKVAEGSAVIFLNYEGYDCVNVTLYQQQIVPVDRMVVCTYGWSRPFG